ncbi:NusG domain II-containing protein [Halanaerobium sp. Z-7514]|uniref:NusG domain II-containing protein n=1 Tax=Halanaerobium polyolivorans TaxID=2886943 RepID=A0AAW4X1L3_9FIRM|nr:NusG domain II-containing protein [Halanaerobium polyolivorans]MCC3145719.1 NusG domain II-containing protein [Halanaerobium polyolivorans]RQD75697.1 MAG: NusG domain II-containing protein [Halanaerobium sp. MSAO_Bac5]
MSIFKILTLYDKILIVLIIAMSILSIISFIIFAGDSINGEKYAVIKINNQEVQRYQLDGSSRTEKFEIEVENEIYLGELVIDEQRVRLKRLSKEILPLSIHSDTGWISNQFQTIIALPIKLTVEIETSEENNLEYDGIVY